MTDMPDDDDSYFDNISDDFADVDWNLVPALAGPSSSTIEPAAGPSSQPQDIPRPSSAHSHDSSNYSFGSEEMDQALLDELDAIETRLTQQESPTVPSSRIPSASSSLSAFQSSSFFPPPISSQPPVNSTLQDEKRLHRSRLKDKDGFGVAEVSRKRNASSVECSTAPKKKGKTHDNDRYMKDNDSGVKRLLEVFEEEMTCPICCDLFAAAQLGNPCGHTFCGECGWTWLQKQKAHKATCPVCRTALTASLPMIPNIAVDNTVQRHIDALRDSGHDEWRPGGARLKDWEGRKERWKHISAQQAKPKQKRKFTPRHVPPRPAPVPVDYGSLWRQFDEETVLMDHILLLDDDDEDYVPDDDD